MANTAFFLMLLLAFSSGSSPTKEQVKLPAFEMRNIAGGTIKNKDLQGSIVIIDFWATWCYPCVAEIPFYNRIQEEYKDRNVIVLGVAMPPGSEESLKKFIKKREIKYRIGLGSGEIAEKFGGISTLPTTLIVDAKGRIVRVIVGAFRGKQGQIEQEIKKLFIDRPAKAGKQNGG
jgi:peroxiredoxin